MQQCTSDDLGPSQSTVSRVLNTTVAALTTPDIVRQFIDFPTDLQTIRQEQADFMRISGIPWSCWNHWWHPCTHHCSNCKWGDIHQSKRIPQHQCSSRIWCQLQDPRSCAKMARVNTWCSGSFPEWPHWVIRTKLCSPWMSSAGRLGLPFKTLASHPLQKTSRRTAAQL